MSARSSARWTAFRQPAYSSSRCLSFQVGQRFGSFQLARNVAKAMKVLDRVLRVRH